MSEESPKRSSNPETEDCRKLNGKLGVLSLVLTLLTFSTCYLLAYFSDASMCHHQYLNIIAVLLSLIVAVAAFILPYKCFKIPIVVCMLASLALIGTSYYLKTVQYVFLGIVKDYNFEKFELKRTVFLIFKNDGKVKEDGTALDKKKFMSTLKSDIEKNTNTKLPVYKLDIKDGVEKIVDAQYAIDQVINSGLTSVIKEGVVVITAKFNENELKNKDIKRDDDLEKIYKEITGKDINSQGSSSEGKSSKEKSSDAKGSEET